MFKVEEFWKKHNIEDVDENENEESETKTDNIDDDTLQVP